jgi:hypothetical protein
VGVCQDGPELFLNKKYFLINTNRAHYEKAQTFWGPQKQLKNFSLCFKKAE